jgi:hypothetical protein
MGHDTTPHCHARIIAGYSKYITVRCAVLHVHNAVDVEIIYMLRVSVNKIGVCYEAISEEAVMSYMRDPPRSFYLTPVYYSAGGNTGNA